jgi:hypothetical protein
VIVWFFFLLCCHMCHLGTVCLYDAIYGHEYLVQILSDVSVCSGLVTCMLIPLHTTGSLSCSICITEYNSAWFILLVLSLGQGDNHCQVWSEVGDSRWSCTWEQGISNTSSIWHFQLLCFSERWHMVSARSRMSMALRIFKRCLPSPVFPKDMSQELPTRITPLSSIFCNFHVHSASAVRVLWAR